MLKLTRAQREAVKRVWLRLDNVAYKTFRKTACAGPGCIMIPFCNMWLGIEPDGHTHS
jgi:hypothetical protein